MPDKYGDVIIPMTILRRLARAFGPTQKAGDALLLPSWSNYYR